MNKAELVLCLVDGQNIYYTPREKWGRKIDYGKLLRRVERAGKNRVVFPIAFLVSDPLIDSDLFVRHLEKMGYQVRMKLLYHNGGSLENTNWDDEIIAFSSAAIGEYDTLAMVSGDSDFIPLLNYARNLGKRVEVFSFEDDLSHSIESEADEVFLLDESICMNPKKRE
ncbi:MAG: NYN domain-containing protein [Candidatus Aminicenantes bacterium]|nr:NYN domain-containing protein [Candidatus Aminicenantes bacterium]